MESEYLVVYDIAHPRRIAKVAAILLNYGMRVQKSIFEVRLHEQSLEQMQRRLRKVIDPAVDGIKIFRLCEGCRTRKGGIGKVLFLQDTPAWIIL